MPHPLAEVFGFPTDSFSPEAIRCRENRLCPFGNLSPNCTKSSIEDPIGVCSVWSGDTPVITCPVRFRQGGTIIADAAAFFFPKGTRYATIPEVRLKDGSGRSAGNIDYVLVSHDESGIVTGYGAVEVQAVYISGNVRTPFKHYLEAPAERSQMEWRGQMNYPRPDFLSSSRKRLAPQLVTKGGILNHWGRKIAVSLDAPFFQTLPPFEQVSVDEAEVAWFVYALDRKGDRFILRLDQAIYTNFASALSTLTEMSAGDESEFLARLQSAIDSPDRGRPLDTNAILTDDF